MKIYMENVDFNSWSGPNQFGKKLAMAFLEKKHQIVKAEDNPDIQLSFIRSARKVAPLVQRLDGIHYNPNKDWQRANKSIFNTYQIADGVIFQSEFSERLCTNFFGKHDNTFVIQNGTDLEAISKIAPFEHSFADRFDKIWSCSSRWTNRPNKRLKENIEYFLEKSGKNDGMIVIGPDSKNIVENERIFYLGKASWEMCISVYKRSDYFIHLSFVDNCPNVVVDAVASDCHVICPSCAGSEEIAGPNSTVIEDFKWDFKTPIDPAQPPKLNFDDIRQGRYNVSYDIKSVANKYIDVFRRLL